MAPIFFSIILFYVNPKKNVMLNQLCTCFCYRWCKSMQCIRLYFPCADYSSVNPLTQMYDRFLFGWLCVVPPELRITVICQGHKER